MPRLTSAADRNILSYFDDQKRLVAKLMARENITVVIVDGAPTASFDPISRTLSLPNWPFVNVDQYDTQLCHEVGHALWTNTKYLETLAKRRALKVSNAGLFTYINVIEDTRIERKMREAYPGVKRIFYNGRKAFAEHGPIFQVAGPKHVWLDDKKTQKKAVAELKFIDRINLFYKIGAFIDIPFSAAEQKWLAVIDRCHSTENAVEIAEALHKLAKETDKKEQAEKQAEKQKQQKQQKSKQQQKAQSGDEGEEGDGSGDGEESDEESEEKDGKGKSKGEKDGEEKAKEGGESGDDADDSEEGQDGSGSSEGDDSEEGDGEADGDGEGSEGDSEGDGEGEGEGQGSGDGDEDGEGDGEGQSGDDAPEPSKTGPSSQESEGGISNGETDPSASTDEAMERMLKELAKQQQRAGADIRNLLIKPISDKAVKERTITAAEWVALTEAALAVHGTDTGATAKLEEKWNELYLSTAKHMAAEFTRRKTAKNLQHARTAKTGRLNMNRLASYQITDDLFKHTTTVPNGQSHGIVMVIDGSSSMDSVFANVVDQTLLFANFAFACNIPFEAYMFSDQQHSGARNFSSEREDGVQVIGLPKQGRLVGLINTATDRKSFKRQVRACLALRGYHSNDHITAAAGSRANFSGVPYADLGGTPLYSGMMIMERHVERLKRTMRLDKVTAIVVSDGGDGAGLSFTGNKLDAKTGNVSQSTELFRGQACVVRDTKTKQNFMLVEKNEMGNNYVQPRNATLAMLFDVMKVRHDARTIMLFLVSGSAEYAAQMMTRGTVALDSNAMSKSMSTTKQYVIPADKGVADCCVVLDTATLALQENNFAAMNSTGKTAAQITAAFVQAGHRASANRVFVNTVVPFLA